MPQNLSPCIHRYPGGSMAFHFGKWTTLHPDAIAAFKDAVPAHSRTYNPQSKIWTVNAVWATHAAHVFRQFFPSAPTLGARSEQGSYRTTPPPREPLAKDRHFAALCLLPTAPKEVVNAAYKALVKLAHPDLLPLAEHPHANAKMAEINNAIEALRAEGRA